MKWFIPSLHSCTTSLLVCVSASLSSLVYRKMEYGIRTMECGGVMFLFDLLVTNQGLSK